MLNLKSGWIKSNELVSSWRHNHERQQWIRQVDGFSVFLTKRDNTNSLFDMDDKHPVFDIWNLLPSELQLGFKFSISDNYFLSLVAPIPPINLCPVAPVIFLFPYALGQGPDPWINIALGENIPVSIYHIQGIFSKWHPLSRRHWNIYYLTPRFFLRRLNDLGYPASFK